MVHDTPDQPKVDRIPQVHREVVSYVRRSGRMSPSQQTAWDKFQSVWMIEVPRRETSTSISQTAPPLDLAHIFGRNAPLMVEIGSGPGESPTHYADQHRDHDVLAFEVYEPALASTLGKINRLDLTNVRLIMADGVQGLQLLLPDHSVSQLRVFFPDPWQKLRHHKRRIVSQNFADLVAQKLMPGGEWLLATDWADYAEHMREVLDAHPQFSNAHCGWAPRADRPMTKYEQRGINQGRKIFDLCYRFVDQDH